MSIYLKSAFVSLLCMGLGFWGMNFIALSTVHSENEAQTEIQNQKTAHILNQDLNREVKVFIGKMNSMAQIVEEAENPLSVASKISSVLNSEDDFVSFGVYALAQDKFQEVLFLAKPESLAEFGFQLSDLRNFSADTLALDVKQSPRGLRFGGLAPAFKSTLVNFSYLSRTTKGVYLVRSEVRQDHWTRFLNRYPDVTASLLDSKNKVLVSSNGELDSKTFEESSDWLNTTQDLNLGDLKIVVSSPKMTFEKIETSMHYRILLVSVMAAALALIFSILLSSHLVTPLKSLSDLLERVVSGTAEGSLVISRQDEIGELGRSISQLIQVFKSGSNNLKMQVAAAAVPTLQSDTKPLVRPIYVPSPERHTPVEAPVPPRVETVSEVVINKMDQTQVVSQKSETSATPLTPPPPKSGWFLVRNSESQNDEGPFTIEELKKISSEPGFVVAQAYVYRQGDSYMTPLIQMAGLSRRTSQRPPRPQTPTPTPPRDIQEKAGPYEWYIYGAENRTLGPYTLQQLKEAVEAGQIMRTTYTWRQGMSEWIYVYEIPGFDRRSDGPPIPPVAIGEAS